MLRTNWIAFSVLVIFAGIAAAQAPIAPPVNLTCRCRFLRCAARYAASATDPSTATAAAILSAAATSAAAVAPPPINEYGSGAVRRRWHLARWMCRRPLYTCRLRTASRSASASCRLVGAAKLPESLTVPSTGTTIGFTDHRPKSPDTQAGIVLQGIFWFDDNRRNGIDSSFYNMGDWYTQLDPTVLNTPDRPIQSGRRP